ncbi:BA75_03186T0 [Komagataella pastoris]|uniref:Diphthine--ammonia ligase n=1 Tax=Komagataella pastoris TaxID=4922 RepID=A0A1B2JB51_PICPA|nr:BA75_03186T0 [Komagataella pastoris]
MKFVALVSGGKDSCFNIWHCLSQGHELIAMANLYPPPEGSEELDSFMYQTVGYQALEHYEECIGVPMYRRVIAGTSKNQQLEYQKTEDDEIEDLYRLLSDVKETHPELEAVSVGAILSSYQRTRVEDVCARLSLVALSYLWQMNQLELMGEMCQSGMDARIIKVAAIGLDENDLGKSLIEMYPKLIKLNDMYDVHICGEGGEFETLVFDAPFFLKKLSITHQEVIKPSNDEVYHLSLGFTTEEKSKEDVEATKLLCAPPLLNEEMQSIYDQLGSTKFKIPSIKRETQSTLDEFEVTSKQVGNLLYISNLSSGEDEVESQVTSIFTQLTDILNAHGLSYEHIQSVQLFLREMDDFAKVNVIYQRYFTKPLPSSRVCVQTLLPEKNQALLSAIVIPNLKDKAGVHVRGISYWAPHNIGPYSQSILHKQQRTTVALISGQIPLIPQSMILSNPDDRLLSVALSLQHFDSVKKLISLDQNAFVICYFKDLEYYPIALEAWKLYEPSSEVPVVFAQVTELPKSAPIEWSGSVYQETPNYDDYYNDSSENEDEPTQIANDLSSLKLRRQSVTFQDGYVKLTFEPDLSATAHNTVILNKEGQASKLKAIPQKYSVDIVPVNRLFDSTGKERDLAILHRLNI